MTAENFYFKKCRSILLSDIDSLVLPLGSFSHKGARFQGFFRNKKCEKGLAFCNCTIKKMVAHSPWNIYQFL